MSKQVRSTEKAPKWERLRDLRMADEAARKESGTWGELMVGEIVHSDTASVFVHVWKGPTRPDPVTAATARGAKLVPEDWLALVAWKESRGADEFSSRVVRWNLSEDEALRAKEELIATHRAAGLEIVNPPSAS
jgi:hypothetical protein